MKIQVKLMGVLKDRAPDGGSLEVGYGATIADVLSTLEIAAETIQAVTVNGSIEHDKGRSLSGGDELVILAPVGGG